MLLDDTIHRVATVFGVSIRTCSESLLGRQATLLSVPQILASRLGVQLLAHPSPQASAGTELL